MELKAFRQALWDLGLRRCGLNADWSVEAWHLGQGKPNVRGGDVYVLDDEMDDGSWGIVQRWHVDDDYSPLTQQQQLELGVDGLNDHIEEILVIQPDGAGLEAIRRISSALVADHGVLLELGFVR
ncbi:MAG: hypothetical protein EP330_08510 [Deltaproteobacteria bacterium]|nr:MAG: hypothetical protein EP330_08510 [Deltaproteobacteria bacterium]